MGPRESLDRYRISRPPPGFDPRTVQPVASSYTDSTNPAHWFAACCLANDGLQSVKIFCAGKLPYYRIFSNLIRTLFAVSEG